MQGVPWLSEMESVVLEIVGKEWNPATAVYRENPRSKLDGLIDWLIDTYINNCKFYKQLGYCLVNTSTLFFNVL